MLKVIISTLFFLICINVNGAQPFYSSVGNPTTDETNPHQQHITENSEAAPEVNSEDIEGADQQYSNANNEQAPDVNTDISDQNPEENSDIVPVQNPVTISSEYNYSLCDTETSNKLKNKFERTCPARARRRCQLYNNTQFSNDTCNNLFCQSMYKYIHVFWKIPDCTNGDGINYFQISQNWHQNCNICSIDILNQWKEFKSTHRNDMIDCQLSWATTDRADEICGKEKCVNILNEFVKQEWGEDCHLMRPRDLKTNWMNIRNICQDKLSNQTAPPESF